MALTPRDMLNDIEDQLLELDDICPVPADLPDTDARLSLAGPQVGSKRQRSPVPFFGDVSTRARQRLKLEHAMVGDVDSTRTADVSCSSVEGSTVHPATSASELVTTATFPLGPTQTRCRRICYALVEFPMAPMIAHFTTGGQTTWTRVIQLTSSPNTDDRPRIVRVTMDVCGCEEHRNESIRERCRCVRRRGIPNDKWLHVSWLTAKSHPNESIRIRLESRTMETFMAAPPARRRSTVDNAGMVPMERFFDSPTLRLYIGFYEDTISSTTAAATSQSTSVATPVAAPNDDRLQHMSRIWQSIKAANQGDLTFVVFNGQRICVPSTWLVPVCPVLQTMMTYAPTVKAISNDAGASSNGTELTAVSSSATTSSSSSTPLSRMGCDSVFYEEKSTAQQLYALLDTLVLNQVPDTTHWTAADWQPYYDLCNRWLVDTSSTNTTSANNQSHIPIMKHVTELFSSALRKGVRSFPESIVARRIAGLYPALQPLVNQLLQVEARAFALPTADS